MNVTHLECAACGERHEARRLHNLCGACGKPLLVRYDLGQAARTLTKESLKGRRADLWRYLEVLPVEHEENIVSLGEGFTPLLRAARLGGSLGLKQLYIKDGSQQPTQSFGNKSSDAFPQVVAAHVGNDVVLQSPDDAERAVAGRFAVQQRRKMMLPRGQGVISETLGGATSKAVAFFASSNDGATWMLRAERPVDACPLRGAGFYGGYWPAAVASNRIWWILGEHGKTVVQRSVDAGRH